MEVAVRLLGAGLPVRLIDAQDEPTSEDRRALADLVTAARAARRWFFPATDELLCRSGCRRKVRASRRIEPDQHLLGGGRAELVKSGVSVGRQTNLEPACDLRAIAMHKDSEQVDPGVDRLDHGRDGLVWHTGDEECHVASVPQVQPLAGSAEGQHVPPIPGEVADGDLVHRPLVRPVYERSISWPLKRRWNRERKARASRDS